MSQQNKPKDYLFLNPVHTKYPISLNVQHLFKIDLDIFSKLTYLI